MYPLAADKQVYARSYSTPKSTTLGILKAFTRVILLVNVTYNLGQNKWNIWTTPPHYFNDAKMARFCSFVPSSLLWGGRGSTVPFYSVQDCSFCLNT